MQNKQNNQISMRTRERPSFDLNKVDRRRCFDGKGKERNL